MMKELILYRQKDEPSGGLNIPYLTAKPDGTFEPLNIKNKGKGT